MKKISVILAASLFSAFANNANAQVSDVSFIASPSAQYTWWDSNLALGNTMFWGARAGFGFGEFVELSGIYERSYDMKGKIRSWAPNAAWVDKLDDSKASIQRYGGELKVNLWPNTIVTPYITAGTGIMEFKYDETTPGAGDNYKEKQIYGALGAGLKVNFTRRIVLSLEANNTLFNVAAGNRYLKPGVNPDKVLQNWSAGAGLDFYFGGTNTENETELERAYRRMYNSGFSGVRYVLEPGAMYIDFDKNSVFNDQYFFGGAAGVDFNSIFGVRGFYYQATKMPNKVGFKFNKDLKMYGGNFIARLNMPRGVTPYLSLGAGYLDAKAQSDNVDPATNQLRELKSGVFAFAGAGVEVPLWKFLSIYGNVNAMINEQEDPIKSITDPNDVTVNMMYQAGLRFTFGRSPKSKINALQEASLNSAVEEVRAANMDKINDLRSEYEKQIEDLNTAQKAYEERIEKLNAKLNDAIAARDNEKASRIIAEKQVIERQKTALAEQSKKMETVVKETKSNNVTITPAQFQDMVNKVVAELEAKNGVGSTTSPVVSSNLSDLDKILLINALQQSNLRGYNSSVYSSLLGLPVEQTLQESKEDKTNELISKMNQILDKMDKNYNSQATLNALQNQKKNMEQTQPIVVADNNDGKVMIIKPTMDEKGEETMKVSTITTDEEGDIEVKETVADSYSKSFFVPDAVSLIAGPAYYNTNGFAGFAGLRAHYTFFYKNLEFVPELTFGYGSKFNFDASANFLYRMDYWNIPVVPYFGVGAVYSTALTGVNMNTILGVEVKNILSGNLFVDYSSRGLFSGNVLSVGYKCNF